MGECFVNLTNHPSCFWNEKQLKAARQYGEIVDIPFPQVGAKCGEEEIEQMAELLVARVNEQKPRAVLCQGEFSLTYQIVKRLKEENVLVLTACSERRVIEDGNKKLAIFQFEKFREY